MDRTGGWSGGNRRKHNVVISLRTFSRAIVKIEIISCKLMFFFFLVVRVILLLVS